MQIEASYFTRDELDHHALALLGLMRYRGEQSVGGEDSDMMSEIATSPQETTNHNNWPVGAWATGAASNQTTNETTRHTLFAMDKSITITVVNNTPFYAEQLQRGQNGHDMAWDDGSHNNTRVGDAFGFLHGRDKVEIHRVCDIKGREHRHEYEGVTKWSNDPINKRKILVLTPKLCEIPWSDWVQLDWHFKLVRGESVHTNRGTERIADNNKRIRILNYINGALQ